jgi:hypothetical protein
VAVVYLYISPHVAIWVPPLIPLVMRIIRWRYRQRKKPAGLNEAP